MFNDLVDLGKKFTILIHIHLEILDWFLLFFQQAIVHKLLINLFDLVSVYIQARLTPVLHFLDCGEARSISALDVKLNKF